MNSFNLYLKYQIKFENTFSEIYFHNRLIKFENFFKKFFFKKNLNLTMDFLDENFENLNYTKLKNLINTTNKIYNLLKLQPNVVFLFYEKILIYIKIFSYLKFCYKIYLYDKNLINLKKNLLNFEKRFNQNFRYLDKHWELFYDQLTKQEKNKLFIFNYVNLTKKIENNIVNMEEKNMTELQKLAKLKEEITQTNKQIEYLKLENEKLKADFIKLTEKKKFKNEKKFIYIDFLKKIYIYLLFLKFSCAQSLQFFICFGFFYWFIRYRYYQINIKFIMFFKKYFIYFIFIFIVFNLTFLFYANYNLFYKIIAFFIIFNNFEYDIEVYNFWYNCYTSFNFFYFQTCFNNYILYISNFKKELELNDLIASQEILTKMVKLYINLFFYNDTITIFKSIYISYNIWVKFLIKPIFLRPWLNLQSKIPLDSFIIEFSFSNKNLTIIEQEYYFMLLKNAIINILYNYIY